MKNKTIIITGTHHTPAIETIKQLQEDDITIWKIYYLGDLPPQDPIDVEFIHIPCGKYNRNSLFKTLLSTPKIIEGFFKSLKFVNQIKPDLILSFGGYVSVPVVIASWFFKIPSITHEQTLTISLATKINSFFVNKVALSFPIITSKPKYVITGNILRREIYQNTSKTFANINKPFIYITGGNQGSSFINSKITKLISKFPEFTFIHQTGNLEYSKYKSLRYTNYYPYAFIQLQDIGWILKNATLVISRAGANTCQELAALNKNSILIPLPFAQQNEQLLNAKWLQSQIENTIILPQSVATTSKIAQSIKILSTIKPSSLPKTKKNSLLNLIYEIL